MALYHKWDVKTSFNFAPKFFMLISDYIGGVKIEAQSPQKMPKKTTLKSLPKFPKNPPKILKKLDEIKSEALKSVNCPEFWTFGHFGV